MSKEKIFIVEDETIISMELTHRLIKSDYQIVGTVTSGEEAIKLISSAKPDLILMDIFLSGEIDGINTAEEIRKSYDIPIIYITAFADEKTLNRAKATGPYGYIIKPFDQKDMETTIEIALYKHKTELKLKESEERLRNLNAAKDKFFSIVAHDLKSPFQGLLGYSSILEESFDELDRDEIKKFISHITSATKNLYNLTSQLLTWSRLQTGRMEFNPIKSNLYNIVINVIGHLSSNARVKGIKINNEVGVGTFVKADEMMLNIILENLLSNAIKFSMTGGIITFLIQKEYPEITLCIRDNGIGMQESTLIKLFRIDESHTSKGTLGEEGTGLGLILSKEMIEKMKGKIYIESKFGAETSVYLTLPAD
jgi:signal transduction histidine kinase